MGHVHDVNRGLIPFSFDQSPNSNAFGKDQTRPTDAKALVQTQRMVPNADVVDAAKVGDAYRSISDWLKQRQNQSTLKPAFCG